LLPATSLLAPLLPVPIGLRLLIAVLSRLIILGPLSVAPLLTILTILPTVATTGGGHRLKLAAQALDLV
jgi:hypothetical protein